MTDGPVTSQDITDLRETVRQGRMTEQMFLVELIALVNRVRVEMERMTDRLTAPSAEEARIRADERRKVAKEIAQEILAVDPVEWALAGQRAGEDAVRIVRRIGGLAR
ncbi:hypothetical protein Sme01_03460 [Sphaerisporangium melleum]|uniref:Uncharacterized protein n=1 Tax=Sphaerisporangium melleum TaxID=321316 RepID=A0A917QP14_9ACTN|nr:hypothetical protein [Sphaerisporangium melleum]GGK61664.1 hypothetical protein GCM10007964_01010 [Sphaerisporangium melleum]GII67870.1 hypothetical protein Sme01_03460 [Sphaerisporangium melleum]